MKKSLKFKSDSLLLVWIFLFSLSTQLFATQYVVDDNAQCSWFSGDCRNTCVNSNWSANNFKTIQDAVNAANDSSSSSPDTILICNGTYNESILTKNNANALTIKAADGQNDVKIISSNSYGIRTNNSTNLSIEGISIEAKNNAIDLQSNAGTFKIKNVNLQSNNAKALYANGSGNNFLIDGVKIVSAAQQAIQIENGNNGSIKNSCIGNSQAEGLYVNSSNSLEVTQTCFANVALGKKEALLGGGSNNPYFHENYWERHDVSGINTNDTVLSSCPHSCNTRSKFSGSNLKAFSQIYKKDIYGDIKIFGNTILGEHKCTNWSYDWWSRETVCTNYANTTVCPADDTNNAKISTKYVDIDSDSSTFDSSSSNLTLAAGSSIKKAYLYWQGLASADDYPSATKIKLKVPNASNYVNIQAMDSKVNWSQYESYFPYQATADITEYVKSSGTYTVADLFTIDGQVPVLGTYGAWSIVVVYENENESLKNITVYDGYTVIDENNEQTISLSGFLTPTHGNVNSKFLVFAGEGDVNIFGDYIQLDGTTLKRNASDDGDNAFNSSITENGTNVTSRNPSCKNNLGIDIHTYDVGTNGQNIIKNSQTTAKVKLGSDGDTYYPSVFAFSTELYIPDICYEEVFKKDGEIATSIFAGDILSSEVTISNKSSEPAKGVSIKRTFDDSIQYARNSTMIKQGNSLINKTDIPNDDEVTFNENTDSLIIYLGTGANQDHGGVINLDQNETFQYNFKPQVDGNLTSFYLVSYTDESDVDGAGAVTYSNVPIGKCSNRDETSTILPILPSGKVRIVESGKTWSYSSGALFTKIVNMPTQYDILYATNENGDTLTSGEIKKIELLDIENITNPSVVATLLNGLETINMKKTISYTFTKAYKRLQFRITLEDDSFSYSNDFTVRPASFYGNLNAFAGEDVTLNEESIVVYDSTETNYSPLYTQKIDMSNINKLDFDPTKTCAKTSKDDIINIFSVNIQDGKTQSGSILFNDIGEFWIELIDKSWTSFSDDKINEHCIKDSSSNISNGEGKFGCNFEGKINVSIQPYELNVMDSNFTASTGQNWLYDANVSDMFVTAHAQVEARNMQHQPLINFTNNCYAQPVDLSFFYDVNNTNNTVNLSYTPINGTMTSALKPISDLNKTITIPAFSFATARASADYRFNVDRAYNLPLSPIDIALQNVDVTSMAVAKIVNNQTVGKGAHFYYGRVKTKDIVTDKTSAPHLLHVEVYSSTPLTNGFYQNSLNWYINGSDDGTTVFADGNFSENKGFINTQPSTSTIAVANTQILSDGVLRFNVNNLLKEQASTIHVAIPTWLWSNNLNDYNNSANSTCATHPCFDYKFIPDLDARGIRSGTTQGSTIGRDFNASYQKSGVKTFR
ncbi:MAG: hypothetical protein PHR87_10825 [Sulfurospirillaceae bacterium]|nr:hypothetical protein [Sulfurospirillaceae bacterium]